MKLFLVGLALLTGNCRVAVEGPLRITFFDVGQGDAALIRTPEGRNILIDAGPGAHTASLLNFQGVSNLDLVILSHAHRDHYGGIAAILKRATVEEIWYSGLDYDPRLERALRSRTRVRVVRDGDFVQFGRLKLTVFHPSRLATSDRLVNNDSLVVKAAYPRARILFPGDCELGCWEQVFREHRNEIRADILKAAHHGSNTGTNSGVLLNVRPSLAIISCGIGNRYGHPDPLVLKLLVRLGARILRTDLTGTIQCEDLSCKGER